MCAKRYTLSGIQYPKSKQDLVQYASQKVSTVGQDLYDLIKSLPSRIYRDSADVAISLGTIITITTTCP
jgi:uncharacterized protein DUF2795